MVVDFPSIFLTVGPFVKASAVPDRQVRCGLVERRDEIIRPFIHSGASMFSVYEQLDIKHLKRVSIISNWRTGEILKRHFFGDSQFTDSFHHFPLFESRWSCTEASILF